MTPPPLRVLMTADAVGGVWVYSAALAQSLCRCGYRVTLVTLGPAPSAEQLRGIHGIRGLDVEVTGLPLEWMDPDGSAVPRARIVLRSLERRIKPHIVHLNGYREACGQWGVPVLVAAHSCVRSWWQSCWGSDPSESRWIAYSGNVRAGLAAADVWVTPSAAFRDTIEQIYAPPTAGRVIWNGLGGSPRAVAKEPFILAAGRLWDKGKNIASLSHAASHLAWPVCVAGSLACPAGDSDHAEKNVSSLSLIGELPRRDLLKEMRRASIFVAPALYEPFGLTVLEAAQAGCALVLSDIASFRELWDGAALFVDPRDQNALQAALTTLIGDERLRRGLQRRAALRARRYSLSAMVSAYRDLYQTMISTRPSAANTPRATGVEASL
jgi:glycosyltransferase involved in cell wall biosynthesis